MVDDETFFARSFRQRRPQPRRLRWLLIALAALLCILTIVFAAFQIWVRHAMRASLPTIAGTIHVAGLNNPITVLRDHHGIPHIHAQSLDDLFFAQGYITAQDRLWQMDILRRHGAGELAEIFGPSALAHDRVQRTLQLRHTADVAASQLDANTQRMLQDYALGVNAFIDEHAAANAAPLPAEFRVLHYAPRHWQVRDTLLLVLVMAQDFSTTYPTKLGRERIMAKLPPELSGDLYPVGSWRDHPPAQPATDLTQPQKNIPDVPPDETQSHNNNLPDNADLIAALNSLRNQSCDNCRNGSNNWVVAGEHTASKLPLLSNDMHLAYSIPNIWYIADLEAPGFHAAGVTLPGAPFVVVGHNENIAWGFSNLGADVQDLYVEQINSHDQSALTNAAGAVTWQPIEYRREVIHVRSRADVTIDVRVTAHGPIITPLLPHEQRQISLRWVVYEPGAVSVPFYAIDTAQNWQQFCAAFAQFATPAQNVVYADTSGHIGYHAAGWVPNRPNGLNATPIIGGQSEWQGLIPFDALAQVYDPPAGLLATANARTTLDDDPHPLTLDWDLPYRNERIWKLLQGRDGLRRQDMLALQMDNHSDVDQEMAQRFAYAIDHATNTTSRLRQAADILRNWNGDVTINSPAPAILDAARTALWPMLLQPRLGDEWKSYIWGERVYVQEELVMHQPARWLPPNFATWSDLLAAAVAKGLSHSSAPRNLTAWHWGQDNSLEIKHTLYGMVPFLGSLTGTGVHPLAGDITTVDLSTRTFGPSQRFTADMSDLDASTMNIVTGESDNPYSPYYRDQWSDWYNGTTFSLPFTDAAVAAAAEHTLILAPINIKQ
jgi:penicillin amidase